MASNTCGSKKDTPTKPSNGGSGRINKGSNLCSGSSGNSGGTTYCSPSTPSYKNVETENYNFYSNTCSSYGGSSYSYSGYDNGYSSYNDYSYSGYDNGYSIYDNGSSNRTRGVVHSSDSIVIDSTPKVQVSNQCLPNSNGDYLTNDSNVKVKNDFSGIKTGGSLTSSSDLFKEKIASSNLCASSSGKKEYKNDAFSWFQTDNKKEDTSDTTKFNFGIFNDGDLKNQKPEITPVKNTNLCATSQSTTNTQIKEKSFAEKILDFGKNAVELYNKTAATVDATMKTYQASVIEGMGIVGEKLDNGLAYLGAAVLTPGAAVFDTAAHAITGTDVKMVDCIWDTVQKVNVINKGFNAALAVSTSPVLDEISKKATGVSLKEHFAEEAKNPTFKNVKESMDFFWNETETGQNIKNNTAEIKIGDKTIGHDEIRKFGNTVGEVAETGALMIGGGAVAGELGIAATTPQVMAAVGGTLGAGGGSRTAWDNGATTEEGIKAGLVQGAIDAAASWLGGEINAMNPIKSGGALSEGVTNFLNTGSRVVADAFTGGAINTVHDPLVNATYAKGYFDEKTGQYINYDDDASFVDKFKAEMSNVSPSDVVKNVVTAGVVSTIGEAAGATKLLGGQDADVNTKSLQGDVINGKNATELSTNKVPTSDGVIELGPNDYKVLSSEVIDDGMSGVKKLELDSNMKALDINLKNGGDSMTPAIVKSADLPTKTVDLDVETPSLKDMKVVVDQEQYLPYSIKTQVDVPKGDGSIDLNLKQSDGDFLNITTIKNNVDDVSNQTLKNKVISSTTDSKVDLSPKESVKVDTQNSNPRVYQLSDSEINAKKSELYSISEEIGDLLDSVKRGEDISSVSDYYKNKLNRLIKIQEQIDTKQILSSDIMNENLYEMKKEILDTLTPDMSLLERARKLYIEMNKRFSYDPEYLDGSDFDQYLIYDKYASFDQIESNNIICKSWSELYRELLYDAGFGLNDVSIKSAGESIGSHRWIEFNIHTDTGIRTFVADATDGVIHTTDLANCKMGSSTVGFMEIDPKDSGARISRKFIGEVEEYGKLLLELDKKIGYVNGDNYFDELMIEAKNQFGNDTDFNAAIFGSDFSQVSKVILEAEIDSSMDGLDAYIYYNKIKNILDADHEMGISIDRHVKSVNGSKENFVTVYTDEGYLVYSKSTGKHLFDNATEYVSYFSQFS